MIVFVLKIGLFSVNFENKIDHNSGNKNRNNRKIDFSFVTTLYASSIKMGPFMTLI